MSFLGGLFKSRVPSPGRLTSQDREQALDRWNHVEELVRSSAPSNLKMAVIEADKIIDDLLKVIFPGQETMGERLKLARPLFSDYKVYDDLWYAHKIRNALVHERVDFPSSEARPVVDKYLAALSALGAS